MRKESYHQTILQLLEEFEELSTGDIYYLFKERRPRYVPAMTGITNILNSSKKIMKSGQIEYYEGSIRRRYFLWKLKE